MKNTNIADDLLSTKVMELNNKNINNPMKTICAILTYRKMQEYLIFLFLIKKRTPILTSKLKALIIIIILFPPKF